MKSLKNILGLIVLSILIILVPSFKAEAASGFKYKDYSLGKYVKHTGAIPKYNVDGLEADLSEQPAMISERNIAYASVNGLFRDVIGATTKYTKSRKCITITYKGHVLKMYIGETRAEFDGEEVEAPSAPIRIKYKKGKIMANLVPTRFVCELFGMEYNWDQEACTVYVNIPFYYEIDGETIKYVGTKGKITFEGEEVELYDAPSIIINDTALINSGSDIFEMSGVDFEYDEETDIIKISNEVHSLVYCINSRIVYVDGLLERCSVAPMMIYLPDKEDDVLYIPGRFTMENLGFYYYWNYETGTSEVYFVEPNEPDPELINGMDTGENENSGDGGTDVDVNQKAGNTENADSGESGNVDDNTAVEDSNGSDTGSSENSNASEDESTEDGNTGEDGNTEEDTTAPQKVLINVINTVDGYKFFIDKDDCVQTLKLPVPEGIESKDIELRETLLDCITDLVIKGDYSGFYKEAEIINSGESILQIQIYYDPAANETIIRLLSDIVIGCGVSDADDNSVNVRMDFVKNIYKKVIVIDAGHGAHDPGAQSEGYNESDLNLKVLLNCRELFKDTDIKVYYTRIDDTFLSLYDRAAFAELVGADMFIAIHHNSSWYKDVCGTSVYYGDKDTTTSLNGLTSETLAWKMLNNLAEALETKVFGEGVINKNFVVVRDSKAPAVLLEIGFMSNHDELSRLVNDKFSKKVAKVIFNTVMDIYEEAD